MSNRKSKHRRRKRAAQRRRQRVMKQQRAAQFIKTIEELCEEAEVLAWTAGMTSSNSYSRWPWVARQMADAIAGMGLRLSECTPCVLRAVFAVRDEYPFLAKYPHWLRTLMNKVKVEYKVETVTGRLSASRIYFQQIPKPVRK